MRRTYVFRQDEKGDWYSVPIEEAEPISDLRKTKGVIEDTISPTWHPADGQYYTSKSAFRRTTKAAGCYEAGNDLKDRNGGYRSAFSKKKAEPIRKDLIRAYKESRGE